MISCGYEPECLQKSIWTCTGAMVQNDGSVSNQERFWKSFSEIYGSDVRSDEAVFTEFYQNEFQEVRNSCGFAPQSSETVQKLKEQGFRLLLVTNPLFPSVATESRVR